MSHKAILVKYLLFTKHKYANKELIYASLKDLVADIRCARRDHCAANPLLGYAETCIAEFRALWNSRHCHSLGKVKGARI